MIKVKQVLLCLLAIVLSAPSHAQTATVAAARAYANKGDFDKAAAVYAELYSSAPDSIYHEYMTVLLQGENYQDAEKLLAKQNTLRNDPFLKIDEGRIFFYEGKYDRAEASFNSLLQRINGDLGYTESLAKAFINAGLEDYAIETYQHTGNLIGGMFLFSNQLARLYSQCGRFDKTIEALLSYYPNQNNNLENTKATLLDLVGNNPDKLKQLQKSLVKLINDEPNNLNYVQLLTWVFTQKSDWDGALMQMEAIDERGNENGVHLFEFARTATSAHQYEIAQKAYDDVIAKGEQSPFFILAKSERLGVALKQLEEKPVYTHQQADSVVALYDTFMLLYPKYYGMQAGSDLAMLLAQYDGNVPEAINVLNKGLNDPDIKRDMAGQFKLQLGDYYLLEGKIWDASLTYSQVDKEFKQDQMGEDARFRNAKLAYYRGDFDWAQRQLMVLKSATSELISNDAIYLSVLITENVQDSDLVPLQRFANAGLLVFQNKDKEAEVILDSINKAYPKHPLNDDILMVRADMARKHHEYDKAIGYLQAIYKDYGKDVLGDDAVFDMADIYQNNLHQNDKAKQYYEQLLIDYPGSTYVQIARQRLTDLNNGVQP